MIVFDVKIMGRTMFHILSITARVEMCVVGIRWGGGLQLTEWRRCPNFDKFDVIIVIIYSEN